MDAKSEFVLYDAGSERAQACWLPNPWKSEINHYLRWPGTDEHLPQLAWL
jgi:hypothetical protein